MDRENRLSGLRKAIGVTAEMALIFYRAEVEAGATQQEAVKLTQAYLGAVLFGQNNGAKGESDG